MHQADEPTLLFEPAVSLLARLRLASRGGIRADHDQSRGHGRPALHQGPAHAVATVVEMIADGMTTDEILAEHLDLAPEDIRESLLYAAEAVRGRELPLRGP
jgi:uncharacterized protein (DUF433 family)